MMDSSGRPLMAERGTGFARRRRERRLRSFWRHEKLAIQMALSEAMHHSAPRGAWHVSNAALRGQKPDRAGEAAGTEFYAMSEVDELLAAGVRPPSLGEPPRPVVRVGQGAAARDKRAAVLQMVDHLIDVLGYFGTLVPDVAEQVIEVPENSQAPQLVGQLVEVPTVPFSVEQIIDNPVPGRGASGHGGLQDFLPEQSSTAFGGADHRIPSPVRGSRGGGPQGLRPEQSSTAFGGADHRFPSQVRGPRGGGP